MYPSASHRGLSFLYPVSRGVLEYHYYPHTSLFFSLQRERPLLYLHLPITRHSRARARREVHCSSKVPLHTVSTSDGKFFGPMAVHPKATPDIVIAPNGRVSPSWPAGNICNIYYVHVHTSQSLAALCNLGCSELTSTDRGDRSTEMIRPHGSMHQENSTLLFMLFVLDRHKSKKSTTPKSSH